MKLVRITTYSMLIALALTSTTFGQANFNETEPNDSMAAANTTPCMNSGDTITGNSTASSGAGLDYYNVVTCAAPLAIYRHRLTITTSGTAGHTGTIRGQGQTAAAAGPWPGAVGTGNGVETAAQTTSTAVSGDLPIRTNQWYGFGKAETTRYRVTGTSTTTANYVSTLTTSVIVPTVLGSFAPGLIEIKTFGISSGDSDMWVYDSNLDAIAGYGNDDNSTNSGGGGTGVGLQGILRRTYAPGDYFLAMTSFNLASDLGSPSDDDFRTGTMLYTGNSVLNSSTTTTTVLDFRLTDSAAATVLQPFTHSNGFQTGWFKFTVTPEPSSVMLLALGAFGLIRRRR